MGLITRILCLCVLFVFIQSSSARRCERELLGIETYFQCPGPNDPADHISCCGEGITARCCQLFDFDDFDDEDIKEAAGWLVKAIIYSVIAVVVIIVLCVVLCCCCPFCLLAKKRRSRGEVLSSNGAVQVTVANPQAQPLQPYPQQQPGGYPAPQYPPQQGGYPAQGYPQQGYPQPGYPQPGYPGEQPPAYAEKQPAYNPNMA